MNPKNPSNKPRKTGRPSKEDIKKRQFEKPEEKKEPEISRPEMKKPEPQVKYEEKEERIQQKEERMPQKEERVPKREEMKEERFKKKISKEQANEKIKKLAQELYEKRGYIHGHELDDWLEAEKNVKKEYEIVG